MSKSLRILVAIVALAAYTRPASADVQVDEQDGAFGHEARIGRKFSSEVKRQDAG